MHNGHLDNDDELFERYGMPRSTPHITVDSEAIMMLVDALGDARPGARARARLGGGRRPARRPPGRLTLAKRASRPLCVGRGDGIVLFASTREPLELARDAPTPAAASRRSATAR